MHFAPYLFAFLLVASFFGGAILLLARSMERTEAPEPVPSDLGRAIGLTPEGPHEASTDRNGIPVRARWTSVRRGAGNGSRIVRVMRFTATLDPPLALGLELRGDALVGGSALGPEVQRAVLEGAQYGLLAVSDAEIAAEHDGWPSAPGDVRRGVDVVHQIALALRASQRAR